MDSQIKTYSWPGGEIQRVQTVYLDDWGQLDYLRPEPAEDALDRFADIYRKHLVPACPILFGKMVMFRLPEGMEVPFSRETKRYGIIENPLTAAAVALQEGVRIVRGKPRFRNEGIRCFYEALEQANCIRIVSGLLPFTAAVPVDNVSGYLTETDPGAAVKVNASFFIMDKFDCATVYDHIGTALGLCVKDGIVTNPPLYGREALLVRKDGFVMVAPLDIRDMTMEIGGKCYRHGENAVVYTRPKRIYSPGGKGTKLVIVGSRVAAVCKDKAVSIPASGFVLCPEGECDVRPGDAVHYRGLEDVRFGIQVGNSILRDGVPTEKFISRFYNIRRLQPVPYPPSLYPMNFQKSCAARIALGADKNGKPMLLWAEGANKLKYTPGTDSRGASLADMAIFCADAGMVNAVNLDGGGSAQLLLNNKRSLHISDRNRDDNSDVERPVPLGLMVK